MAGRAAAQDRPAPKEEKKRFDDHATAPLEVLIERLKSKDTMTRSNAAAAIGLQAVAEKIGVDVRPQLGPLPEKGSTETFKGEGGEGGDEADGHDDAVRRQMGVDLTRKHPEYAPAIPILRTLVAKDPDEGVRINAAGALAHITPRDEESLEVLAQALTDKSAGVRHCAVAAFACYSRHGKSVVSKIRRILRNTDWDIRTHAAVALTLIGEPTGEQAALTFAEELPKAKPEQRQQVAKALYRLEVAWMTDVVPRMVAELEKELGELEKR